MNTLASVILLGGFWPIFRAWRSCRFCTVRHALGWLTAAWASICADHLFPGWSALEYLSLCLIACTGVAVLGARRPGVFAWHFVVVGLLAVLSMPIWQGLGEVKAQSEQLVFLAAALGVALANYLPTRQAGPALLVGLWAFSRLLSWTEFDLGRWPGLDFLLGLAPWLALLVDQWREPGPSPGADWLLFRDRYGLVWGQRMREQFNRAAENAGSKVVLRWSGELEGEKGASPEQERACALLRAILQRFHEPAHQ